MADIYSDLPPYLTADFYASGATNPGQLQQYLEDARKQLGFPSAAEKAQEETRKSVEKDWTDKEKPAESQGLGEAPGQQKGTSEFGPMSPMEAKLTGLIGTPMSMAPMNPATIMGLLSSLAAFGGAPRGGDPRLGAPTPGDIQDITDVQGQFAGKSASAKAAEANKQAEAMMADLLGESWGPDVAGRLGLDAPAHQPGGWMGQSQAPEAAMENPDAPVGGWAGMAGLGESGNKGQSADANGGHSETGGLSDPSDAGGHGGIFAKGGVKHFTKKTKITAGEPSTDGETGIFLPHKWFNSPEIHPNEPETMMAMLKALHLLGNKYNV